MSSLTVTTAEGLLADGANESSLRAGGEVLEIKDLHAAVLRLLGIDQMALKLLPQGCFKRLIDTGGRVLEEILT